MMALPEIELSRQTDVAIASQLRRTNKAVLQLVRESGCSKRTAQRKLAKRKEHRRSVRERLETAEGEFSPLIKPCDNWNFNQPFYIDGKPNGHGYIPGELYANCLWYWTKAGDVVVAPMAGCGQIRRVYDDRMLWMRPEPWELDLRLFDLTPQHPWITQNDLTISLPLRRAHYIVLDVPYLYIAAGQYSDKAADLANMDATRWSRALAAIAHTCRSSQQDGDHCTVIATNYRAPGRIILATVIVRDAFAAAGYTLADLAYASRRIQQTQNIAMARANNKAKRKRLMLSDIAEVMTFRAEILDA